MVCTESGGRMMENSGEHFQLSNAFRNDRWVTVNFSNKALYCGLGYKNSTAQLNNALWPLPSSKLCSVNAISVITEITAKELNTCRKKKLCWKAVPLISTNKTKLTVYSQFLSRQHSLLQTADGRVAQANSSILKWNLLRVIYADTRITILRLYWIIQHIINFSRNTNNAFHRVDYKTYKC